VEKLAGQRLRDIKRHPQAAIPDKGKKTNQPEYRITPTMN